MDYTVAESLALPPVLSDVPIVCRRSCRIKLSRFLRYMRTNKVRGSLVSNTAFLVLHSCIAYLYMPRMIVRFTYSTIHSTIEALARG